MTKSIRHKQRRLKRQTSPGSPYMPCKEERRRKREKELLLLELSDFKPV